MTWSTRSASAISPRVLRKEETRWCGSLRMKPTVSEKTTAPAPVDRAAPQLGVEGREEAVLGQGAGVRSGG